MNEDFRMEQGYKEAAYGDSLGRYTAKTFGWMFIGLLITFGVAIGMYMTDGLYYVSRVPGWYYILFIAEIGIVVYLSARINQMTVGMARTMFFLYAAVNGIVFSVYFLVFDVVSLWMAFAITAAFFGVMALKYQFLCAASIYDGRTDLFSRFLAVVHVYQSVCL